MPAFTPKSVVMYLIAFFILANMASAITDVINITTGNALVDMAIPLMVALFFIGLAIKFIGK